MLNESLFLSSFDDLKNILLNGVTIFDIALSYVLLYVIYKALGRYIYFSPQEHISKINRTFLALSLFVTLLHFLASVLEYLPFSAEHRWLYAVCGLMLLIAPLSILMDWVVWKYDRQGHKDEKRYYQYLPLKNDYYKTPVGKSTKNGIYTDSWEVEEVESTSKNLHSDSLLNLLALVIFVVVGAWWAGESVSLYGLYPVLFFVPLVLWVSAVYLDRTVFSWIKFIEWKGWRKGR